MARQSRGANSDTTRTPAPGVQCPVRGQVQNSPETFRRNATGHLDGGGNLQLVSTQWSVCKGNFVYVTRRQGEGVCHCDEGRLGPFTFVSTGRAGTGYGTLGTERSKDA